MNEEKILVLKDAYRLRTRLVSIFVVLIIDSILFNNLPFNSRALLYSYIALVIAIAHFIININGKDGVLAYKVGLVLNAFILLAGLNTLNYFKTFESNQALLCILFIFVMVIDLRRKIKRM